MTKAAKPPVMASRNFDAGSLTLSELVGKPVTVYSKQFPGKPLPSHVHSVSENKLHLSTTGNTDQLNNLVNGQTVDIQLPYRGEWISINATLRKTDGGRCGFEFEGTVVPLSQRKFVRIKRRCEVQMSAFSLQTFCRKPHRDLRWIKTSTLNFSSGGTLIEVPGYMDGGLKLLMNVDVEYDQFPSLILAEVRYCHRMDNGKHVAGVEFVVREMARKSYSPSVLSQLPALAMQYTATQREKINRQIQAGTSRESSAG